MQVNWPRAAVMGMLTGAFLYIALQFLPDSLEGQSRALAAAALGGLAALVAGQIAQRVIAAK